MVYLIFVMFEKKNSWLLSMGHRIEHLNFIFLNFLKNEFTNLSNWSNPWFLFILGVMFTEEYLEKIFSNKSWQMRTLFWDKNVSEMRTIKCERGTISCIPLDGGEKWQGVQMSPYPFCRALDIPFSKTNVPLSYPFSVQWFPFVKKLIQQIPLVDKLKTSFNNSNWSSPCNLDRQSLKGCDSRSLLGGPLPRLLSFGGRGTLKWLDCPPLLQTHHCRCQGPKSVTGCDGHYAGTNPVDPSQTSVRKACPKTCPTISNTREWAAGCQPWLPAMWIWEEIEISEWLVENVT